MTEDRYGCEDKNECIWQPCGRGGTCENIRGGRGWMCYCPDLGGQSCTNCSCDHPFGTLQKSSVFLGGEALAIILISLFAYLRKILLFG